MIIVEYYKTRKDGVVLNRTYSDAGMILTNGDTYSKRVYLGVNDTPENWHEIPDIQTNDPVGQIQSGGGE